MTRAALVAVLLTATTSYAQTADDRPVHRIEVDAGGGLLAGADLGQADASLRANAAERRPYRLFSADSRFASAPALHVRAGYALTRRYSLEGGLVFTPARLQTSLSADVEGAAPRTVDERVDQYFFEASLLVLFEELRLGRGTIPFVAAGGGYLRQLHEGQTVIEYGQVYHVGGGVRHWFLARDRGFVRAAGVRADARLYLLAAGISLDDGPRPQGAISGSVFVTF